jgi:hypothetical protein
MHNNYSKWFQHLFLVCLTLLVASDILSSQLILERELIGAVAVPVVVSNGGAQQLQVDASFGETMIGYEEGDIIITVGFHQTPGEVQENNLGDLQAETEEIGAEAKVQVNAYPNPTVERLTIDLGSFHENFEEIRLIDINGRTVKHRAVIDEQLITFTQLDRLPNANYFLQGIDKKGRLHQLTTVLIITY